MESAVALTEEPPATALVAPGKCLLRCEYNQIKNAMKYEKCCPYLINCGPNVGRFQVCATTRLLTVCNPWSTINTVTIPNK